MLKIIILFLFLIISSCITDSNQKPKVTKTCIQGSDYSDSLGYDPRPPCSMMP